LNSQREKKIINEIKNFFKRNENATIKDLLKHIDEKKLAEKKETLRIIERLRDNGEIKLFKESIEKESSEIKTYLDFLLDKKALDFWISLIIVFITLPLVILVPDDALFSGNGLYIFLGILRIIFGGAITIFLPGYALISILYPKKEDIDNLQKFGLSFGLSIVIVVLIGLILNFTPVGISLIPILFSINLLTLGFAIVFIVLRMRVYFAK
jgi:hypothetical protein